MLNLLVVVIVAASAWSGYWFIGARALEREVTDWMQVRVGEGWLVEYSALDVVGFPNRFDLTLRDLEMADPETGLSWTAPYFQILALSYQPNHLIAVWPDRQTVATPYQSIEISAGVMTASLVIQPGERLELDRGNLVLTDMALRSSAGWDAQFDNLSAAIRQSPPPNDAPPDAAAFAADAETGTGAHEDASGALGQGPGQSYDIAAEIAAFRPPQTLRTRLDAGGTLPDRIEGVRIDATVGFATPLDRRTIEDRRPDITAIDLKEARGAWGSLELRAKGAADVDSVGVLDGSVSINARNWRDMLEMAVRAGAIPADIRSTVEMGLSLVAGLSGGSESLDATLDMRAGRMFLGPIPIGAAPRVNLR